MNNIPDRAIASASNEGGIAQIQGLSDIALRITCLPGDADRQIVTLVSPVHDSMANLFIGCLFAM